MAAFFHLVRPHLFAGQTTYEVESDGLVVRNDAITVRIPYADITAVRFIDYPNFGGSQKQVTVKSRAHDSLKIRSHHYVSLGNFDDRSVTFEPLFRELCKRVSVANPHAEFIRGSHALRVVWGLVLACAVFGWIGWIAAAIERPTEISHSIPGGVVLLLVTFLALRAFTKIRAVQFDPLHPPV